MAGYITHGQEKSVVLSASQVDALVAGGSGDAALLYLLLQRLAPQIIPCAIDPGIALNRERGFSDIK